MSGISRRRVEPEELRRIFNEGQYWERLQRGELFAVIERSAEAQPSRGQPAGTLSKTLWYFDADLNKVAFVHQYTRPDGSIGASGRPDPKRIT